ncbi:hypothetical protein [Methanobacterium alcaliphilum]|uniref:hypothetical protein n=1 Tax=Methanobacterium alcaliphilum TaxID=392018 RepID=UPI00200B91EB|nr:hypothetical protein [Methanobacterium alcaliphilum]MCK9150510.1 hypothetical protein [Methanobacterium alcaliphilum]
MSRKKRKKQQKVAKTNTKNDKLDDIIILDDGERKRLGYVFAGLFFSSIIFAIIYAVGLIRVFI